MIREDLEVEGDQLSFNPFDRRDPGSDGEACVFKKCCKKYKKKGRHCKKCPKL